MKNTFDALSEIAPEIELPQKLAGIYFLFQDGELKYIGKTTDVYRRLKDHIHTKKFNRVLFFEIKCPTPSLLTKVEQSLIAYLNPLGNVHGRVNQWKTMKPSIPALEMAVYDREKANEYEPHLVKAHEMRIKNFEFQNKQSR